MKILIRPTKFMDINNIMSINLICLPENYPKDLWIDIFNIGKEHCFVAEVSKTIIGYIFCNQETIISFAINPEFQNKGIGKQLLSHCLNTFTTHVNLNVRISNEKAINIYKKFDFDVKDIIKDYYINPNEDCIVMKRLFSSTKYIENRKINIK